MTSTIIQCVFQSIYLHFFRAKSISKGKKLFESRHVSNVRQIIDVDGKRIIEAKVLPQTRVTNPPYDVTLKLNGDRTISTTQCGCKAGLSLRGCKHVAAVAFFINNESSNSKTDQPQVWNQPKKSQVEKFKKGVAIESLFPTTKRLIDWNQKHTGIY